LTNWPAVTATGTMFYVASVSGTSSDAMRRHQVRAVGAGEFVFAALALAGAEAVPADTFARSALSGGHRAGRGRRRRLYIRIC
jgi:hypothetical protein